MKTIKLGGKTFEIDLDRLTVREYRAMFDDAANETKAAAKACGMETAEVEALPWNVYRKLVKAVVEAAAEPLEAAETDPNP